MRFGKTRRIFLYNSSDRLKNRYIIKCYINVTNIFKAILDKLSVLWYYITKFTQLISKNYIETYDIVNIVEVDMEDKKFIRKMVAYLASAIMVTVIVVGGIVLLATHQAKQNEELQQKIVELEKQFNEQKNKNKELDSKLKQQEEWNKELDNQLKEKDKTIGDLEENIGYLE